MKNIICVDLLNGSLKKTSRILENLGISNSLYIHNESCVTDIYDLIVIMNMFPTFNKNILLSKIYINRLGMVVGWVKYNKLNKTSEYCSNVFIIDEMLKLDSVDRISELKKSTMFNINLMSKDELIVLSN